MALIEGTPDNDELTGEIGDEVQGLEGDDVIDSIGENNTLRGGAGNDELTAYLNDQLFGDEGDDILEAAANGGSGNTLNGGSGNDYLSAGNNDSLDGGEGSDFLVAGAGSNTLTGGNGADIFLIANQELPGTQNTVADFNASEDTLSVAITNVDSLDDLGITADGANTVISFNETTIAILENIAPNALNDTNVTFEIGTSPENNPPIADDDTASTNEDTPITIAVADGILQGDTDPDDDNISITQVDGGAFTDGAAITLGSGAILTLNADGSYIYNPNGAFEALNDGELGEDSFTYTISDGTDTDTATVTINITGITDGGNPDAPDAVNDTATVVQGSILTIPAAEGILANDSDPDGIETVDITEVNGSTDFAFDQPITLASGAILTLDAEGGYVYDPNGKTGSDSFTYTISDGTNEDTATVNITITGEPGSFTLDIDGNGGADAATDGLLIIRHLFGFQGDVLTEGALAPDATRTDAGEIINLLEENSTTLDIDGNGSADAATDGLLIIRRLFGFQDSVLVEGAVAPNATITDAGQIADIIDGLAP
jgi:VCBS repeat-containing protein